MTVWQIVLTKIIIVGCSYVNINIDISKPVDWLMLACQSPEVNESPPPNMALSYFQTKLYDKCMNVWMNIKAQNMKYACTYTRGKIIGH